MPLTGNGDTHVINTSLRQLLVPFLCWVMTYLLTKCAPWLLSDSILCSIPYSHAGPQHSWVLRFGDSCRTGSRWDHSAPCMLAEGRGDLSHPDSPFLTLTAESSRSNSSHLYHMSKSAPRTSHHQRGSWAGCELCYMGQSSDFVGGRTMKQAWTRLCFP